MTLYLPSLTSFLSVFLHIFIRNSVSHTAQLTTLPRLPFPNTKTTFFYIFIISFLSVQTILPMSGTLTLAAATTPILSTPDNRFAGTGTKNTPTTASLFKEASPRLRLRLRFRCQAFTETRPDTWWSATGCGGSRGSLYDILRINNNASPMEIKAAYRTLAKLYHPDASSSDDGHDFIQIHNAYATLSDPNSRALYDLSLSIAPRPSSSSSFGFYPTRRWETDQCW